MKYLLMAYIVLIFAGCKNAINEKARPLDTPITIAPIKETTPDSLYHKIHSVIADTEEYQSLKQQYKDKLVLLVYRTEMQSMFEVSVGHVIFNRFSTSLRLYVNLSSQEIKVFDFEKGINTLLEYRKGRKI